MSLRVEFRPEAEADLLNARDWYEEQHAGLGEVFWAAVESVLQESRLCLKCMSRHFETLDAQRFGSFLT